MSLFVSLLPFFCDAELSYQTIGFGISEVITFMGFIVAFILSVLGVIVAFVPKYIDFYISRHDGFGQIYANKNRLYSAHQVIGSSLLEISSLQKLYGGLFVRFGRRMNVENLKTISAEIGRYDYMLEKCIHEMNLFSEDVLVRHSAIRALSEDYGDLKTLGLMEKCYHDLYLGDADLRAGIQVLSDRIQYHLEVTSKN